MISSSSLRRFLFVLLLLLAALPAAPAEAHRTAQAEQEAQDGEDEEVHAQDVELAGQNVEEAVGDDGQGGDVDVVFDERRQALADFLALGQGGFLFQTDDGVARILGGLVFVMEWWCTKSLYVHGQNPHRHSFTDVTYVPHSWSRPGSPCRAG